MGTKLFNNSWFLGVKGFALILLAIYSLIDRAPEFSSNLISTSGYIFILSGIAVSAFGLSNRRILIIWFFVTEAIADVFIGFIMLVGQGHFENRAYQWIIGVWILTMGFFILLSRLEKTKFKSNKVFSISMWVVSVITGLLFLLPATSSALSMSSIFGAYLVLIGAYFVMQFMKYSRLT
jgi:uncharacterized membrane protein HdeD (DUF308 family)